jgi:outer membrane cobalamin receptor
VTVVPTINIHLDSGSVLTWRVGATVDYSNRDDTEVSPLLGVTLSSSDAGGTTEYAVEYAATSQLPGYTALNSGPSGLFGGNAFLGREKAKQLSASISRDTGHWQARATLFSRRDENLVDWTYSTASPFARQANPVDIDVIGLEGFLTRSWEVVDLAVGYTALDKDADYGTAPVDASFYALNFAKHRATLAVTYRFAQSFELRIDNEYRIQEDNPLRVGDDSVYLASASLVWTSARVEGLSVALVVDNVTDSEYQPFPGTPASGRQTSLSASYAW